MSRYGVCRRHCRHNACRRRPYFKCNGNCDMKYNLLLNKCISFSLYRWAVTPMTYPAAFVFQVPSTAYLSMACGNMLIGIVTVLTTYILDLLANDNPVSK